MVIHLILVSAYLVVLLCGQDWKEAVSVCFDRGHVMESNLTVLSNYLQQNNNVKSLWSGSYIAMLPWMEILGCFRIKWKNDVEEITFAKSIIEVNSAVCQFKCSHARYFAVNSDTSRCVCFDDQGLVDSPSLSADECLQNCLINDTDCFELLFTYKVLNETDLQLDIPTDTLKSCVYSDCISSQQHYENYYCNQQYIALCRDGQNAVHSTEYASYDGLVWGCLYRKTFPLLLSADICDLDQSYAQHWIGVRSQTLDIHHMSQYDIAFESVKRSIVKCGNYSRSGINFGNCSIQNHFICNTVNESSTSDQIYSETSLITSDLTDNSTIRSTTILNNAPDLTDNSTIRSTTILNNAPDMMVGIVVSLVVITLILVVLLVVLLRRKYSKDKLSLKTAGREDRDTNEMDNYIIISDYQQLDKVKNRKTKTKPYDQLHVKHIVDLYPTDDHSNTLFSKEENNKYESIENTDEIDNNKVTLEYEVLDKTQQDKITKAYDQLHYTHVVDTDSTYNHSTTIIESEEKHKTSTNTTSLEYEELNNAEKDKSVNVYEQLNTTNEGNFNSNMSKTMISTEEHINNESIEAATAMNKHTVTLEYAQLDIAGKDEGMNVYDQLYVTP